MYLYKGDKLFWNDSAALPNILYHFNRFFGYARLTQIGSIAFGNISHRHLAYHWLSFLKQVDGMD